MVAVSGATVSIRVTSGYEFTFESDSAVQSAAYRWTYALQSRSRWQNDENYRVRLADKCYQQLIEFGLTEEQIEYLSRQELIEVSVPFVEERLGWEVRTLPWEFILGEATRAAGRTQELLVVRHLDRDASVPRITELNRLLFFSGSPGPIGQYYDFSGEKSLVDSRVFPESYASGTRHEFDELVNPSLLQIDQRIKAVSPQLVHVAGVDTHQGATQFGIDSRDSKNRILDGMVLRSSDSSQYDPVGVSAHELAKAITAAREKPACVFFNLHNSAARLAAMSVAYGAGAAVGFQDQIDDQLAENFVGDFYEAMQIGSDAGEEIEAWDSRQAFLAGMKRMFQSDQDLKGSGVVYWSADSICDGEAYGSKILDRAKRVAEAIQQKDSASLTKTDVESVRYETQGRSAMSSGSGKALTFEIQAKERLNFSLLHNRQAIFDRFEIRKPRGHMQGVRISVELHIGSERPRYTQVLDLTHATTRLEKEIFIALTWMRTELFWESVLISAQVEVTWEGRTLYSRTHPILMDPADDWIDTDENRQSLPSFVYPRDPSVIEIIRSAQETLYGLTEDYTIGFDGYQRVDPESDDGYDCVDQQVQAIWTTLVRNFKLNYINPPPSFTDHSQRIRTPEEVIQGGRGTCIDLTMLLASCLEYVEIYPVLFLLQGHAFPGYWRSDILHQQFIVPTDLMMEEQSPVGWQESPWLMGKSAYREVVQEIHAGNIVPLESVWLTQNAGFWEAVEQGWENMRIASEFHSLIDVRFARNHSVTPLPIRSLRD